MSDTPPMRPTALYARISGLAQVAACVLLLASVSRAEQRTQTFDSDPGWEGVNNRLPPKKVIEVTQDFGFSATSHAGPTAGEMGGVVMRASDPAFYADKIP